MRCLIIGAGPCDAGVLRKYGPDAGLIICADGGVSTALSAGLSPHVLIGDGDSSGLQCPEGCELISLLREKDITDLHACVDFALGRRAERIILAGCTGGRLDHFLAALFLLERIHDSGSSGLVVDGYNAIRLHTGGEMVIDGLTPDMYLSVLPIDGAVTGVTLEGLKYPLNDATILRSYPIGVSNCASGPGPVRVKTGSGRCLVITSKDS